MMKGAVTYDVAEFRGSRFQETQVISIQEVPLTIYLNSHVIGQVQQGRMVVYNHAGRIAGL